MDRPAMTEDATRPGPSPAFRFVASWVLGLAGFAGSFLSPEIVLPPHTISIAWYHLFPLLAAMAYGPGYGVVAGTVGLSAFSPFHAWPANGWANIVPVLAYPLFYALHGQCAANRLRQPAWHNNPFLAQLLFTTVYGAATIQLYPPLFAQNPPPWSPAAPATIPEQVLFGIALKGALILYGCVLAAAFLFKTPLVKRMLGLESPDHERFNGLILAACLAGIAVAWLLRGLLLTLLAGEGPPRRVFCPDEPGEIVSLVVVTVTCLVAGYLILLFVERRNIVIASLRRGEERYRLLVENTNEAIFVIQQGRFRYANRRCGELFGVPPPGLLGRALGEFTNLAVRQESGPPSGEGPGADLRDGRGDVRFLDRDGKERWATVNSVPVDWNGAPATLQLAMEISERKRAEEAIQQEMILSETIINRMPGLLCLFDDQGNILRWNRDFERVLGYSPQEVRMRRPVDFFPEAEKGRVRERIAMVFADGFAQLEAHIIAKDGKPMPYALTGVAVSLNGQPHVLVNGIDITEHRRTDEAQKARLRIVTASHEKTARELMQAALDEIEAQTGSTIGFFHFILADEQTIALQVWSSRTLREMCTAEGAGSHYPVAQGGVWVDCVRERAPIIHNDYPTLPHRRGLPPGHAPVTRELLFPIFREGRIVAIVGVGNKPSHYLAEDIDVVAYLADFSWEIISRTQAEERVRASLKEKELLLREVHHRVKNNLQIIASLFRLTNRSSRDPKAAAIFRESQDRIRAMADVHSMLYRSRNLSEIPVGEYIHQMARQLFRSYNTNPESVVLRVDAEQIMLPIDAAIPCGLIINELISNALKHAFPAGRGGEIDIGISRTPDGLQIRFADNGVGLPEGLDFRRTESLGLQLVNLLVAQLNGTIAIAGRTGTSYEIRLMHEMHQEGTWARPGS